MASVELLITGFLGIVFIALFLSIRAKLPYTVILVFVGISLAVVSNTLLLGGGIISGLAAQMRSLSQLLVSGGIGGLFVGLIVPPLLFEAMMHISSRDLKAILRPALVLATVGVVVATLVGGLVLWLLAGLPLFISLLFAAVISPTDTATVLEIFRRVRVPARLAALLDTEAAFNDATGIVVFTVVLATITVPEFHLTSTIMSFALIFGGGLAVGFGVSFVAEILLSSVSDKISSVVLTISAVYGSYAAASSLGFSGLVAVAVVGLYFGNLTIRSVLGATTREFVKLFWEIAAFFGNTIAFLFIGFRVSLFQISAYTLILVILAYLAVTMARAASVYPILTLFDRVGFEKIPLQWRNIAMMGGVRGALSIALAASIVTSSVVTSSDVDAINTMVFGVALISITVQAWALSRYSRKAFRNDQTQEQEKLSIRLAKAVSAIETLQKMNDEGKISPNEFADQLEKDKDDLAEILSEINSTTNTASIARARALDLYSSVRSLRNSNAMNILRRNSMSASVEKVVEDSAGGPSGSESKKKNNDDS
ncbi:MAG: sodium:proton antiporter [Nitrososphaerota archaeon]|nr:sodium:proton antiporter [Nitrososphaerota archaeon]MDG6922635.1 sodium:proton antiporter [Nitrososphaerota archaeon]